MSQPGSAKRGMRSLFKRLSVRPSKDGKGYDIPESMLTQPAPEQQPQRSSSFVPEPNPAHPSVPHPQSSSMEPSLSSSTPAPSSQLSNREDPPPEPIQPVSSPVTIPPHQGLAVDDEPVHPINEPISSPRNGSLQSPASLSRRRSPASPASPAPVPVPTPKRLAPRRDYGQTAKDEFNAVRRRQQERSVSQDDALSPTLTNGALGSEPDEFGTPVAESSQPAPPTPDPVQAQKVLAARWTGTATPPPRTHTASPKPPLAQASPSSPSSPTTGGFPRTETVASYHSAESFFPDRSQHPKRSSISKGPQASIAETLTTSPQMGSKPLPPENGRRSEEWHDVEPGQPLPGSPLVPTTSATSADESKRQSLGLVLARSRSGRAAEPHAHVATTGHQKHKRHHHRHLGHSGHHSYRDSRAGSDTETAQTAYAEAKSERVHSLTAEEVLQNDDELKQDIKTVRRGLSLFFNSQFTESESILQSKSDHRMYFALGEAFVAFLKACMVRTLLWVRVESVLLTTLLAGLRSGGHPISIVIV